MKIVFPNVKSMPGRVSCTMKIRMKLSLPGDGKSVKMCGPRAVGREAETPLTSGDVTRRADITPSVEAFDTQLSALSAA